MCATNQPALQLSSLPPPFVSAIVKAILHSPLHGMVGKNTMLLTWKGRKSGKVYSIPVLYTQDGNRVICFTNSSGWKKLRDGAPVTLVIKGQELQGRATPLLDDKELSVREHSAFLQQNSDAAKLRGIRLDTQKQTDYDDVVRASQYYCTDSDSDSWS